MFFAPRRDLLAWSTSPSRHLHCSPSRHLFTTTALHIDLQETAALMHEEQHGAGFDPFDQTELGEMGEFSLS